MPAALVNFRDMDAGPAGTNRQWLQSALLQQAEPLDHATANADVPKGWVSRDSGRVEHVQQVMQREKAAAVFGAKILGTSRQD